MMISSFKIFIIYRLYKTFAMHVIDLLCVTYWVYAGLNFPSQKGISRAAKSHGLPASLQVFALTSRSHGGS